jgi:radical SAM protein with 4Fe4S-binding SPASM domain
MDPDRRASTPPRMLIQWHITERCNLRCAHCYQESPPPEEPPLSRLFDVLDRIEKFVRHLRNASQKRVPVHLTITGGEPFMHPGFAALIERIASHREKWSYAILSNGSLLDEATAERLRAFKPAFVQISLEGSEPTHDRIRGAGSFKSATRALRLLVERRIPAFVSFTVHRDNVAEFPAVAALCRSRKVTRLWCDRMIPLGRGGAGSDRLLSPGETRAFFETMKAERSRWSLSGTEIAMHRALQFLVGGGEPYRCCAGNTLLTILPDGSLCPCRRMPLHVGNVLDRPIAELYFDSPVLRSLRDHGAPAECSRCFYSEVCRGGLRCLAHAVQGTPFVADPGCWLAPQLARAPASPSDSIPPCATCNFPS